MADARHDTAREIEVWNRAAAGEPASDRQGDQALAHALRLLGYAEGDGLLSAVEHEHAEDCPGTGSAALSWFGLHDAARLVDEVASRWADITDDGSRHGDVVTAGLSDLEVEADRAFAALDVGEALQSALRTALQHRPEHFAEDGATTTAASEPSPALPHEERAGWAVRIPEQERLRRTVMALEAFGLRADSREGQLVVWPPDDAGWDVMDEVLRLLDLRYPVEER